MTEKYDTLYETRPELETDLEVIEHSDSAKIPVFVIRNKITNKYMRVSEILMNLLRLLDGTRSIRDALTKICGSEYEIDKEYIVIFFTALYKKNIIIPRSQEDSAIFKELLLKPHTKNRVAKVLGKLGARFIKTKLPIKYSDVVVNRMYDSFARRIFKKPIGVAIMIFCAIGLSLLILQMMNEGYSISKFIEVRSKSLINIPYIFAAVLAVTLMHESGHAMACKHFGRKTGKIGLMIYFGCPVFYTNVTDTWMLSKYKRVIVDAAGIIVNLVVGGILGILIWILEPSPLRDVLLQGAAINALAIIVNLLPLLKYDGYHILSDLLDSPKLREKSLALLFMPRFRRRVLKQGVLSKNSVAYFIFGIASLLYTVTIVFCSLRIFHGFLSGRVGGIVASIAISILAIAIIYRLIKVVKFSCQGVY